MLKNKEKMKSSDSLLKKICKKGIPLTLEAIEENIWDVAGVRVICSFQDDIYLLAECLLQQDEKRNVKVEVQLRTIAMDSWASLEHKLKYKKNLPAEQLEKISKELKYCAEMSADLDAHMQGIRERIYKDGNPKKYEDRPFNIPGKTVLFGNGEK